MPFLKTSFKLFPLQKNILYISYDGMTDQLGQSQVLPYLCGLRKYGYKFSLISCEKPAKLAQNKGIIDQICFDNDITWYPLLYTKKPPVLSTIRDIIKIRKKAFQLLESIGFDMVHCRGYIPSLIGLEMKRKKGVNFLFDMRGLWPDEKVDAGSWILSNPLYKAVYNFFKKKEKLFLENADCTISLTHRAQLEIHSWRHIENNPVRVEVIPCCVDLSLFDPFNTDKTIIEKIRNELGFQEGQPLLTYLGSIGSWYMLDEMLDFFIIYCKRYADAKFFFITGDQHELIRRKAKEKGIDPGRIVIRPATRQEVPASILLGSHSVFFIRPTYSKISSSPTKQAELMGMGVPVISNDGVGDTATIIKKYESGVVIEDFSTEAYQNAVDLVSQYSFQADTIREGAYSYFSLTEGVRRYNNIYESIL